MFGQRHDLLPLSSPPEQSYVYCTPSLRRRQSESTKENPLTGLSDLSSTENALPVVTNTSSIESFPKAAALLQRDKLSFSVINRSSIFTPSSSSAIMAAILKGQVGAFDHCLGKNSETAEELEQPVMLKVTEQRPMNNEYVNS